MGWGSRVVRHRHSGIFVGGDVAMPMRWRASEAARLPVKQWLPTKKFRKSLLLFRRNMTYKRNYRSRTLFEDLQISAAVA